MPKSNISKIKRAALKSCKKEESITILLADKGKDMFIMDSSEYDEKVTSMLEDERTLFNLKK